jgi:hypothetical protein
MRAQIFEFFSTSFAEKRVRAERQKFLLLKEA